MSMEDVDKTLVQLRPGQIVTGTVVQITDDEVCVNVGYKADGLVKKSDLSSTDVKVGDEIEVEVVKVNDGEGNVLLSQKNIINRKAWEDIVRQGRSRRIRRRRWQGSRQGRSAGGRYGHPHLHPRVSALPALCREDRASSWVRPMTLKIIEIDKAKKRIVASRKAVLMAEEAETQKDDVGHPRSRFRREGHCSPSGGLRRFRGYRRRGRSGACDRPVLGPRKASVRRGAALVRRST